MSNEDEWGPWIEHTPGPCPVPVGIYFEVVERNRRLEDTTNSGRCTEKVRRAPHWFEATPYGDYTMIVRYRIRTPRGMKSLTALLSTSKEKEAA